MVKIHKNYSLKNNTTFGVEIVSTWFTEPKNIEELTYVIRHAQENNLKYLIIGEGSNLLFTGTYEGMIIHPMLTGVELIDESETELLVKAGAGMNWDTFVEYCVQHNWNGTENLSLIPGSVGAAPVQNIGAYGVEAKDIIEYVEVFNTREMNTEILSNNACEFAYRESIFKHIHGEHFIVTNVVFNLKKKENFVLNYGNVNEEFLKLPEQNLANLRQTIISIRESKLPDPEETGNAGSFFKNPVVPQNIFEALQEKYGSVPNYPTGKGKVKIPAAWLIEKSGWKGKREGDAGSWPKQPLVIVNYGNATGKEIFDFSEKIRKSVHENFDILLEREVTVLH